MAVHVAVLYGLGMGMRLAMTWRCRVGAMVTRCLRRLFTMPGGAAGIALLMLPVSGRGWVRPVPVQQRVESQEAEDVDDRLERYRWMRRDRKGSDEELAAARALAIAFRTRPSSVALATQGVIVPLRLLCFRWGMPGVAAGLSRIAAAAVDPRPGLNRPQLGKATPEWQPVGPRNVNGRIKALAVHPTNPDVLYAASASGGLWGSRDGGESWQWLSQSWTNLNLGAVALAPCSPQWIYAGTGEWAPGFLANYPGEGVYFSADEGASWELRGGKNSRAPLHSRRIARVLVARTDRRRVYVAGESGLEVSCDAGKNWRALLPGPVTDAAMDRHDDLRLYVALMGGALWSSRDGGKIWSPIARPPTSADWLKIALWSPCRSDAPPWLFARHSGGVHVTKDDGGSWHVSFPGEGRTADPLDRWASVIAVAQKDPRYQIAGGRYLRYTWDGGQSWHSPVGAMHIDQQEAVWCESGLSRTVFLANDGGVWRSDDAGQRWQQISHGIVASQLYRASVWAGLSTVVSGGTQDNGAILGSGGMHWKVARAGDAGEVLRDVKDPRTAYLVMASKLTSIVKVHAGTGWEDRSHGLDDDRPFLMPLVMDPRSAHVLLTGTRRLFRTENGTDTPWELLCDDDFGSHLTAIAWSPARWPRLVYVGTADGRIFACRPSLLAPRWVAKDLTTTELPVGRAITDIATHPTDALKVWVSYGGLHREPELARHVFRRAGNGWSDMSGSVKDWRLPNLSVNAIVPDRDGSRLFAANDIGVFAWRSDWDPDKSGRTEGWKPFGSNLPAVVVMDLSIDRFGELLYAATFGRGLWRAPLMKSRVTGARLFLRDNVIDQGVVPWSPVPDPEDPHVASVGWERSPDVKVDAPPFADFGGVVDGAELDEFSTESPRLGDVNHVYVQVHSGQVEPFQRVTVALFWADVTQKMPDLPAPLDYDKDFDLGEGEWKKAAPNQRIQSLHRMRSGIARFAWRAPSGLGRRYAMLAVVSSSDDKISSKETALGKLVKNEQRVAIRRID